MSKIRGIIISLVVFVLSIVGVKADPGNYILKFGVDGNAKCCDCRRKLSETTSLLSLHNEIIPGNPMCGVRFQFKYKMCLEKYVDYSNETHEEHQFRNGDMIHSAKRSQDVNYHSFSTGVILPNQPFYSQEDWNEKPHAFIDCDENPKKYRCIECMIKYAKDHFVSKEAFEDAFGQFAPNDRFLKCRIDYSVNSNSSRTLSDLERALLLKRGVNPNSLENLGDYDIGCGLLNNGVDINSSENVIKNLYILVPDGGNV